MPASSLKALLLVGGKSRRMGTDKASLVFDGQTLLERTLATVTSQIPEFYLSVAHDDTRDDYPTIPDLTPNPGPLGGIQAAFTHDPETAWLVIACDLPLFDKETLAHLLTHADPTQIGQLLPQPPRWPRRTSLHHLPTHCSQKSPRLPRLRPPLRPQVSRVSFTSNIPPPQSSRTRQRKPTRTTPRTQNSLRVWPHRKKSHHHLLR